MCRHQDPAVVAALDTYFEAVAQTRRAQAAKEAATGPMQGKLPARYVCRRHMHVAWRLLRETHGDEATPLLRRLLDEGYASGRDAA